MSIFSHLIHKRARSRETVAGPAEFQLDIGEHDQLFDVGYGHSPNSWQGQAATKMKVGLQPPVPITPPLDLPNVSEGVQIDVHYPYTRPGVGPEDMEPMLLEGEDGF